MGAAAAVIGGAVIGGISSSRAADKGAKAQKDASKQIQQAATDARADILKLFPQAKQELLTGAQGAFDIFGMGIPLQQQQLSQGNLAAQQSVSQGFDQAQAALLGLPTEQFQAQGVDFDTEPFLGGQSLFGTPQRFQVGGAPSAMPTFAGLGGSFDPGRAQDNIVNNQVVPGTGQGGLGTPIQNPNVFLGDIQSIPGFGQGGQTDPNSPNFVPGLEDKPLFQFAQRQIARAQ